MSLMSKLVDGLHGVGVIGDRIVAQEECQFESIHKNPCSPAIQMQLEILLTTL